MSAVFASRLSRQDRGALCVCSVRQFGPTKGERMAKRRQAHPTARERLISAGCLDAIGESPKLLPVRIDQIDTLGENWLFRITNLVTGCCVCIRCLTDEASTPIDGVRLELQLADFEFRWLEDSEGDQYNYRCGADYEFPREEVINNKFPGVLYRGPGWQGWLVGVSCKPLPPSLKGAVTGNVALYDAFGRTASVQVSLLIDPSMPKKSASKRRGSLLELDDMDVENALESGAPNFSLD